jgi:hypothetical protein
MRQNFAALHQNCTIFATRVIAALVGATVGSRKTRKRQRHLAKDRGPVFILTYDLRLIRSGFGCQILESRCHVTSLCNLKRFHTADSYIFGYCKCDVSCREQITVVVDAWAVIAAPWQPDLRLVWKSWPLFCNPASGGMCSTAIALYSWIKKLQ